MQANIIQLRLEGKGRCFFLTSPLIGRFLGMDVHAESIAVAVAEADGEVRSLGTIANREESIRKLVKKLGAVEQLRACYEAGPTGYVLYWQFGVPGKFCTRWDETNWYGRSMEWARQESIPLSR